MDKPSLAIIFVHGLFSGEETWSPLRKLIGSNSDFADVVVDTYNYPSPKFKINPLHRIPNINDIAEGLRTFLEEKFADYDAVIIVSHSQGGLVVQRYLQRTLNAGRGKKLANIKYIIMFACPNSGSELFLLARRWILFFFRHSQAKELGVLSEAVAEAQNKVVHNVVRATTHSDTEWHIPISAYFGSTDNIVRPVSAVGLFQDTGSLPGDHSTIIQPSSSDDLVLLTLRRKVLKVKERLAEHASGTGDDLAESASTNTAESESEKQHWAFTWASEKKSENVANDVLRAVQTARMIHSIEGILSLSVSEEPGSLSTQSGASIAQAVEQSRIVVIIADDLDGSLDCLKLLEAAKKARRKIFVISNGELTERSKLAVLDIENSLVETTILNQTELHDELLRILTKSISETK
ncbi:esterase/lipase family protein [Streptomyces sp. NPDC093221]|uniref:esterase/lipase family protein n=1 Tax=Streptomyces sp. NPDC093221 TaxID=3366032 RepID=UPI003824F5BC